MTEVAAIENSLRVAIVYNPFKSSEIERHELPYSEGATIADYMGDLGDSAWTVGYKGEAYEQGEWGDIVPEPGEGISLVRVPESGGGGGGGKDILRMVAMIAIAVVAMTMFGPWAAGALGFTGTAGTFVAAMAAATFTAAGMMVVNAVLPPPGLTEKKGDGQSYGIDGPKNTSREGMVVPIGFGEYRQGGNITDFFTKNVGDDQYLFIRTVLNDGPVHSVSDIEINDQPISSFSDVQTRISLGSESGQENDWFGEAVRLHNKGLKLTTGWLTQTTVADVDRLRFDLLYPGGLGYHKDDGRVIAAESDVAFEYRPMGSTGAFVPLGGQQMFRFVGYNSGVGPMPGQGDTPATSGGGGGGGTFLSNASLVKRNELNEVIANPDADFGSSTPPAPFTGTNPTTGLSEDGLSFLVPDNAIRATVKALAVTRYTEGAGIASYDVTVCYREVGTTTWIVAGQEDGSVELAGENFPLVYRSYSFTLDPAKDYQVTAFGGTVTEAVAELQAGGNGIVSLVRATDASFRYTYESGLLPRGRYEYRVRRTRPVEDNKKRVDEVYLSDVGEIDVDNIHYVGTANLSLKIKLGEQLNSVSKVTAMVKGSIVRHFDADGNVTSQAWSQWPADHVLDILLNQDRGRGINTSRIDFSAYKEWKDHCIANGLEFNGIFDQDSNVWDAMQVVCRAGHAQLVRVGTRYSFVIDKASEPVQVFNDSNIIEGTFSTAWLPLSERANEIHYTFYPKDEGFKETMIRAIDPDATNTGAGLKVAQITEIGVTNYAQAKFNIEKQLRENKLLKKSISFDAPLEAIALSLGDVAYIQHSSANYGKGIGTGRLKAGSTTTSLNLDCPVNMTAGASYRVLLVQSAVKRYTATVQSVAGNSVFVSGLPDTLDRCLRLKQGNRDTAIRNVVAGNPNDRIVVDSATGFVPGPVELWDTDVIEERTVVFQSSTETLTLTSALPVAPEAQTIWMVGPVETLKKKYRLIGIDGEGLHRRSLAFVDYDDRVYQPLNLPLVPSTPGQSPVPQHVKRLSLSYPPIIDGGQTRVKSTISWECDDERYAGADVYVAINGRAFSFLRSVQSAMSFEMDVALGDDVQVKVNSYSVNGRRAPADSAPVVGKLISADAGDLLPPTSVIASTGYFRVDAAVTVSWVASASTVARDYRVEWLRITQAQYTNPSFSPAVDAEWNAGGTTQGLSLDIPRQDVGYMIFRVRAENGRSVSPWASYKFNLAAPELPDRVTGLRLNNGTTDLLTDTFSGKDARFEWRDVATEAALLAAEGADAAAMDWHWKDYEVRILSTTGQELRRQTTRDPFFTYTYEKNVEDTLAAPADGQRARRAFRIEVRLRGRQEQLSDAAIMDVSNPAPALLTATPSVGVNQVQLSIPESDDTDYAGVVVWSSTTAGFTPSDANKVWMGPGQPIWFATPGQAHYYRYAIYDAFGTDQLNVSAQQTATPTGVTGDLLTDDARDGFSLSQELLDRIDLIDGTQAGSVNARLASETAARQQALTNEATARASAIAGEASARATALQSQASTLGGQITTVNNRLTTVTDDLQQQIDLFEAASGDGYAGLVEERNQRVAADEAFSGQLTTIYSRLNSADAAVISESSARATAVQSVTNALNAQISRIDSNVAAISQETSTRTNAINSITQSINTMSSRVGGVESAITSEATTRASAIEAVSTEIDQLTATVGGNTSAITAEVNARASADSALSTRIDTVTAQTGTNTSAITAEVTARTNADSALGTRIDSVVAQTGTNTSAIQTEVTARTNADSALSTRIDNLVSTTGTNAAAIQTEVTARTNAVSAVTELVNNLTTTVNGNTSTISQHTTSLNGLYAGWGIRINNNGAISGIGITSQIINGTATSTFKVEADKVEFVAPGAGSGIAPFTYDAANGRIIAQNMLLRGQLEVQSAGGGMRTQITNSGMNVYDASNTLRVRLGVW